MIKLDGGSSKSSEMEFSRGRGNEHRKAEATPWPCFGTKYVRCFLLLVFPGFEKPFSCFPCFVFSSFKLSLADPVVAVAWYESLEDSGVAARDT